MKKHFLVKIAHLYYENNQTQQEIADLLGVSRMAVSRALQKARDEGVVDIHVNYEEGYYEMEETLKDKYQLTDILITPFQQGEALKQLLAQNTAQYLQRILDFGDLIGVGWGSTLSFLPQYTRSFEPMDLTFVPILGGVGQVSMEMQPNQIAFGLAQSLGGHFRFLHTPAIVDSAQQRAALMSGKSIRAVLELAKKAKTVVLGIGAPLDPLSTMNDSGYIMEDDLTKLRQAEAVCDIGACVYLNSASQPCSLDLNDKIIGLSYDDLKEIPTVVAVAGGASKHSAIRTAVRSGLIHILITDEETAGYLMSP
jgi:DNA-binding transcriptional regulator LsrR (DeoR family)